MKIVTNLDIDDGMKPRLFVDLTGTLTEWRNFSYTCTSEETATGVIPKEVERVIYKPGYYASLAPHVEVARAVNELLDSEDIDVYVMLQRLPKKVVSYNVENMGPVDIESDPTEEKIWWLLQNIPNITQDRLIIVPFGEKKAFYVPKGQRKTDYLLDDNTDILSEWESYNGIGIKLLNKVNSSSERWEGRQVSYNEKDLASILLNIVKNSEVVRQSNPEKDSTQYDMSYVEFTELIGEAPIME